jgi:D-3-phosphoglycerate dehydrogenase / 2-oxoglutarate reductase
MKILAIDDVHHVFHKKMKEAGHEVIDNFILSKEELIAEIPLYDVLLVRSKFYIDKEILDAMPNNFTVARAGAGTDNIDEEYARTKNIKLINAPEGNRDAVAEHAIGLLLNLVRNINKSDREIRDKIWLREENRGFELKGKTIGIIGYGNTGKSLAKKLSGFEMNVIAYDKYLSDFSDAYVKEVSINTLKEQSDIISLHIPLSSETSHMINRHFFDTLSKKPILINTSRGKVITTSDLVEALKVGKVLGACLDVLEDERINSLETDDNEWYKELVNANNVILSSHIAGWTYESYEKISEVLVQKLLLGTLNA